MVRVFLVQSDRPQKNWATVCASCRQLEKLSLMFSTLPFTISVNLLHYLNHSCFFMVYSTVFGVALLNSTILKFPSVIRQFLVALLL